MHELCLITSAVIQSPYPHLTCRLRVFAGTPIENGNVTEHCYVTLVHYNLRLRMQGNVTCGARNNSLPENYSFTCSIVWKFAVRTGHGKEMHWGSSNQRKYSSSHWSLRTYTWKRSRSELKNMPSYWYHWKMRVSYTKSILLQGSVWKDTWEPRV